MFYHLITMLLQAKINAFRKQLLDEINSPLFHLKRIPIAHYLPHHSL